MRYFLVSFNLKNSPNFGNIALETELFPSTKVLSNFVGKEILVMNIFEFKSREDYLNFISNE